MTTEPTPSAGHPSGAVESASRTWRTISFGRGPQWSLPQLGLAVLGVASAGVFLESPVAGLGRLRPHLVVPRPRPSRDHHVHRVRRTARLLGPDAGRLVRAHAVRELSAWSVPAALALLVGHAAAALSATTPPAGEFSTRTLRRWLRWVLIAALAAPAVALLADTLQGGGLEASPAAYVIGLGGLSIGIFLLRSEPPIQGN